MNAIKKIKLIVSVKKSDLSKEDKKQIINILLTTSLEKGLPKVLRIIGVAVNAFKLFSQ